MRHTRLPGCVQPEGARVMPICAELVLPARSGVSGALAHDGPPAAAWAAAEWGAAAGSSAGGWGSLAGGCIGRICSCSIGWLRTYVEQGRQALLQGEILKGACVSSEASSGEAGPVLRFLLAHHATLDAQLAAPKAIPTWYAPRL